jgi:hypothetical protein
MIIALHFKLDVTARDDGKERENRCAKLAAPCDHPGIRVQEDYSTGLRSEESCEPAVEIDCRDEKHLCRVGKI